METPVAAPGRRPIGPAVGRPIGQPGPRPGIGPVFGRPALGPALGPAPGGPALETLLSRRRQFTANATLVARADLTASIARFVVRPDGGVPPFKPGQYFALGLEDEGGLVQRPYSTASPAGSTDELEFLVRRVPTGTFTPRLWNVAAGERVWVGPPKGLFTLQPGDGRRHLLISTGTGLAPFISMAEALLREERPIGPTVSSAPRVVVVHGVSYAAELAYRDRLEAWAAGGWLAYVPTISRPADPANAGWPGATGRTEAVLAAACHDLAINPAETVAYVCGNPEMIEAVCDILRRRGFPESAVVREHYWTAASAGAA